MNVSTLVDCFTSPHGDPKEMAKLTFPDPFDTRRGKGTFTNGEVSGGPITGLR